MRGRPEGTRKKPNNKFKYWLISFFFDTMKFSIREGLKFLILAPAVGGIAYILTNILYAIAVKAGSLPAGTPYALIVGVFAFALVVVAGLDKAILEE